MSQGTAQTGIGYTTAIALIAALGGFLMGFDASVISGVVGFIEPEFGLSKIQLGFAVASLTLTATIAMLTAGPLSDRLGRRPVMKVAAVLFAVSAIASALATDYTTFVLARMIGGFGVGTALIIAPMYIAEVAPPRLRGRLVSLNQLNIVIGISLAFFSNYLILRLGESGLAWAETLHLGEWSWRWMLGVETLPAIVYFFALSFVPESPRWLSMHGRSDEALAVLERASGAEAARLELAAMESGLAAEAIRDRLPIGKLFQPAMKLVLTIGVSIAILQQITGINAVFFYAPMIFELSGIGTNASFMQAVLVGLVNLVFTVLAMILIDRIGRRPLLLGGLAGIAASMFLLAFSFGAATYTLDREALDQMPPAIETAQLESLVGVNYKSDVAFRDAVAGVLGTDAYEAHESDIVSAAIAMNPKLILVGILGFVASFAVSLGPVMWVLFSELFPNQLRGLAISFVGVINSGVSFMVQLVFPWELQNLGSAYTFLVFGLFAIAGLIIVMRILPETKGKSLEELEAVLVRE